MNFVKMIRIVLWSFFGVRKGASHEADISTVNIPLLAVVAVGLAGCCGIVLFFLARLASTVGH